MKYWEIVADKLSAAGWSWGYCSALTRLIWLRVITTDAKLLARAVQNSAKPVGVGAASQPSILAGRTMPRNTTQTLEHRYD
jgi:hypothetical protein